MDNKNTGLSGMPKEALFFREATMEESTGRRIEFSDKPDDAKQPRFKMTLNTGVDMFNFWFGKVAIDLNGIRPGKNKLPALRDHDRNKIVGWHDTFSISARGIFTEGYFSLSAPDGREALALSKEGFPWQASMTAEPVKIENVAEGATAEVNGRKFIGPGVIFRKSILREGSFCSLGADCNTNVLAASMDGVGSPAGGSGLPRPDVLPQWWAEFRSDPDRASFIRLSGGDEVRAFHSFCALRRAEDCGSVRPKK